MSSSVGSTPSSLVASDLLQRLGNDLGNEITNNAPSTGKQPGTKPQGPAQPNPQPGNPNQPDAVVPNSAEPNTTAGTQGVNSVPPVVLEGNLNLRPPAAIVPVSDVATVLLAEVATTDLSKLTSIIDPAPDPVSSRILDSLLVRAVQEVLDGNAERAVGLLADYATRDPRRAEALPFEPALAAVRDKIDSMVNRMTIVARISAENGLSRAEQTSSEAPASFPLGHACRCADQAGAPSV